MAHHSEYGQGMYVNKCNNCSQGLCLSHYQSRCGQLNAFPPKGEPIKHTTIYYEEKVSLGFLYSNIKKRKNNLRVIKGLFL